MTHREPACIRFERTRTRRRRLTLIGSAALALVAASVSRAAPTSDPFANEPGDSGIAITRPADRRAAPAPAPPSGNPLWAVPLSALTQTLERPLFAPTRRPPPRAVAAAPATQPAPLPPQPAPPEPLRLALIGAVVGDGDAIAVFVDQATQGIVRMRTGQTHSGWALTAIGPREATLTRGEQVETVAIQRGSAAPQIGATAPIAVPAPMPAPASDANGTTYAPFVPRSTPKNGESDGL